MLALKGTHPLVTDWLGVRLGLGASLTAHPLRAIVALQRY
jgi:hypothetical protein